MTREHFITLTKSEKLDEIFRLLQELEKRIENLDSVLNLKVFSPPKEQA